MTHEAVDLFAGPGGWDVAARRLGLDPIGIEFDHWACETRRAAGLATIENDVRFLGPDLFPDARGLIASPPCQTFSMAGNGAGRKALDQVLSLVDGMAIGHRPDVSTLSDERTGLVLEPLRWALDALTLGQPYEWLAFEQVPTVLPVWLAMAEVLRGIGYRVEVGNLQAEQYGVPQTRKRAILVARYGRPVELPKPTHSKFHTRDKTRLDPGVLPWVSMADALGWGMTERPYLTIACSSDTGGEDKEKVGGSGARRAIYAEQEAGRWLVNNDALANAARRHEGEPAPTLTAGHDSGNRRWVHERPATTIVGSFRPEIVAAPGYRVSTADGSRQNAPGSVRVSLEEAALLQSFPADHPWRGSKTKRFQQVGNAIPPLLAEAVLRSVL